MSPAPTGPQPEITPDGPPAEGAAPAESSPPAAPTLLRYRLRVLAGALALALYFVLLARNEIDGLLGRGALPALPGGWKGIAAALGLALGAVLVAQAQQRGWGWTQVRAWAVTHPATLLIAGVTLGAFALRMAGISDNLPYLNQPDEPAVADRALHILQTGDYNPHYFVYPNLYTYMQAAVFLVRFFVLVSAGTIANLNEIVPTDFYLWGRLLTAVLGTLTVPLVYLAGRRLYGITVGLIAAGLMAANNVHILHSQFITTDAPAAFFSALALAAIVWLLPPWFGEDPSVARLAPLGRYVAAGAAVGLAIGTKYNSALVLLPFLLAHAYAVWATPGPRLRRFGGGRLWAGLAALVGAFFLTTPFALFDLPNFLNDLASVIAHYRYGHEGHEGDANWIFYVASFLHSDFWPTVLALAGVALAFLRHRRADVLLLVFPVVFYFSMSNYRVNFERNMLPMLPFTSILAALALVLGWRTVTLRLLDAGREADRRRLSALGRGVLAVLALGVVFGPVRAAAQRDYLNSQPDNRVRAAQWLDSQTRPGTKVWLDSYPPLLTPSRYLEVHGTHVVEHPLDWYVANRIEYLVVSSGAYKDVVYDRPQQDPPLRDAYLRFFSENQTRRVAAFEKNEVDAPGPTIYIYRTGYTPPQSVADVHAQHPLAATFREPNGGIMRLLGADYPLTATVGSALPLTLYWSADPPLQADYTVFVHVIDAAGGRPAQRDVGPRSGTYPTSQWPPGAVVVDEGAVTLPATLTPGVYTLHVGLYVQQASQFLPALPVSGAPPGSGPDYVTLGPIMLEGKK